MPSRVAAAPILCVVGARPNLMKIAAVIRAMRSATPPMPVRLLHTGQHYDLEMNGQFFHALGIPDPDINLEVGSASHAVQTAEIMRRFDRSMPEEINRLLTDQISDLLFITERNAQENLVREGVPESRIHFVGNVMIDTLRYSLKDAVPAAQTMSQYGAAADWVQKAYTVLTLHRPSNVDDPLTLRSMLGAIRDLSSRLPVVFPMHPRTRAKIEQHGLGSMLETRFLLRLPPLGYLE